MLMKEIGAVVTSCFQKRLKFPQDHGVFCIN